MPDDEAMEDILRAGLSRQQHESVRRQIEEENAQIEDIKKRDARAASRESQRKTQMNSPASSFVVRQPRMTLDSIRTSSSAQPRKVLLYSREGVGKTTWASKAPSPIFIKAEDGTQGVVVQEFPLLQSWEDCIDALESLILGEHSFKTVVIDTADWLEKLIWTFVCERYGKGCANIEDLGYGKGYEYARGEWVLLTKALDRLHAKGMNVIVLAHSLVKMHHAPGAEPYERYMLAMNQKGADVLKQWAHCVLFAESETLVAKNEKTKRMQGISTGVRFINTQWSASYDAKNRFGLPPRITLSGGWHEFEEACQKGVPADPALVKMRIEEMLVNAPEELVIKARANIEKYANDGATLARVADQLAAKLAIAEQNKPATQQEAAQ